MNFGSLFSGIGGLDLGLERAGMTCQWQVEIDDYASRVLKKHWPDVRRWRDVKTFPPKGEWGVDLICGGFPCQPVSCAGKRQAQSDARWLWPEFRRVLGFLRPRFALIENVPGLITAGLTDVLFDLAALGFDAEWRLLSAAEFGAPHLRKRLFIVAHARSLGIHLERGWFSGTSGEGAVYVAGDGTVSEVADAPGTRRDNGESKSGGEVRNETRRQEPERRSGQMADSSRDGREQGRPESTGQQGRSDVAERRDAGASWWSVESDVGRVADGVPKRVDRLRGLGNAVVPQVAEWIGRRILAADEMVAAENDF